MPNSLIGGDAVPPTTNSPVSYIATGPAARNIAWHSRNTVETILSPPEMHKQLARSSAIRHLRVVVRVGHWQPTDSLITFSSHFKNKPFVMEQHTDLHSPPISFPSLPGDGIVSVIARTSSVRPPTGTGTDGAG